MEVLLFITSFLVWNILNINFFQNYILDIDLDDFIKFEQYVQNKLSTIHRSCAPFLGLLSRLEQSSLGKNSISKHEDCNFIDTTSLFENERIQMDIDRSFLQVIVYFFLIIYLDK